MKLYRKGCDTCDYICHMEANNMYKLKFNTVKKALKFLYRDKLPTL